MTVTKFYLVTTSEYDKWLEKQTNLEKVQIELRLGRIMMDAYFGIHKYLSDNIWELKWGNGRRVYYAYIPEKKILLLLGGNKNGQSKDVSRAKKLYEKYTKSTD
jgi:putative addiction module killer protein